MKELALELTELATEGSLGLIIADPPGSVMSSCPVSPSLSTVRFPLLVAMSVSISSSAFSTLLA
jgi:hypothetical protein